MDVLIDNSLVAILKRTAGEPTGTNLAKLAVSYSDGIIFGSEGIDADLVDFCKKTGLPTMEFNADSVSNGSYIEDYNSFYDNL